MEFLKNLLFIISILTAAISTQAKVLVYEYGSFGDGDHHGVLVTQIACKNLNAASCETFYSKDLSGSDLLLIQENLEPGDVINMSFSFQKPEEQSGPPLRGLNGETVVAKSYEEKLSDFYFNKSVFENVIKTSSDSLFVAAAGNGHLIFSLKTLGGPLDKFRVYPAYFNFNNLLTVAALNTDRVNPKVQTNYRLMDYSNYSTELVDLAAPVELSDDGEVLEGTSFASPYVARISKRMITLHGFTPQTVKKILLRSAFIENLNKTLDLTRKYLDESSDSVIRKILNERNRVKREELRSSIPDVMLVKSGGALVEEIAFECAKNYALSQKTTSIDQSCLWAHETTLSAKPSDQRKLQEFWKLRGL